MSRHVRVVEDVFAHKTRITWGVLELISTAERSYPDFVLYPMSLIDFYGFGHIEMREEDGYHRINVPDKLK
jgi:hypothetical protein